jgi:hypothetical protein
MDPFETYDDLLEAVDRTGKPSRTLGRAPGGRPIVGVEAGGEKEPGVVVVTGAHSNEHAGVVATVELIERLETDHRVWVVPTRDPVGLDGYAAALELALGEAPAIETHEDVVALLRAEGEVLFEDPDHDLVVGLVGDYGYVSKPLSSDLFVLQRLKEYAVEHPEVLEPLKGRRVYVTSPDPSLDGTEGFSRAYTTVISPEGRPLHLNRFLDDAWAPAESRAVRDLMDEVEPGLTFDNHETGNVEDRAYVVCRPYDDEETHRREREIGIAMARAMAETGTDLATDEDLLAGPTMDVGYDSQGPDEPFYSRAGEGAYWMDYRLTSPPRGGEGPNAGDYAATNHGLAFDMETGMHAPLSDRAEATVAAVEAAVGRFEAFHD